jgi:outer membrane translocation and assembly module TamA
MLRCRKMHSQSCRPDAKKRAAQHRERPKSREETPKKGTPTTAGAVINAAKLCVQRTMSKGFFALQRGSERMPAG